MKKVFVTVLVSLSVFFQGCNFKRNVEQESLFTEIHFPEVNDPVNLRDFETRSLAECFKEYKTYVKPDEFPFYPIVLKDEIVYGKTWDPDDEEKGTSLGFIDYANNTSGIIATSSYDRYSNMMIETISDNQIIYRQRPWTSQNVFSGY